MTETERPTPEDFLESVHADTPSGRGNLRVYLGMCPGVGKTYTMLEDARRRHKGGANLLVGWVDTHGRSETAALTKGLPLLARKKLPYRDTAVEAFDIDAALQSGADILLVDELAHTNAPGSRHPKRWQDIEELLAAGIDVWTTLNIQHVESLRDAVAGITGVRVQETVPDTFLDGAHEIRVIDLMPEQLRERMAEGKIYLGERAAAAAGSFFREGNLRALREMALRFATRKVDAEKRGYMRRHRISGPWRAGERFLVAVGPSPYSERLIRIASRLAQAHDASWIALHVDNGVPSTEEESQRLAANLSLARSLGAETISIAWQDPLDGILHVARRENITQIVAGKALKESWWRALFSPSVADRLQRETGPIDLHLVHPGVDGHSNIPPRRSQLRLNDFLGAFLILVGATLIGFGLEAITGHRPVAFLYLLAVAITGVFSSRMATLCMAVASGLTWNFFFTEPRLTFNITASEDVALLVASVLVAAIIGHLTTKLRDRELASRLGEERARALYQFTRVTAAAPSLAKGVTLALKQVDELFRCRSSVLVDSGNADFSLLGGPSLDEKENSVCRWALDHGRQAGRFTDTLPESQILALPLFASGKPAGVLAIRPSDQQLSSPIARDLLETFATHFSVMLEKEDYQKAQRESALGEKSRQFQRALLDHVSHEIKTPVAVILGSSEQLIQGSENQALLLEIKEAALRLNRVFNQLVTLSRAEAGLIEPEMVVCDAHDVIQDVRSRFAGRDISILGETFSFRTDPSILDTVLFNLLQNAIQYGEGPVKVEAAQRDGSAVFSVSSAGKPIPASEQSRIFERFQRGSQLPGGGMGLGLAISKEFAKLLGGDIRLEFSGPDRNIFVVEIPDIA